MRFIGTCEVLGAFGLILPGVVRLWTTLTPLQLLAWRSSWPEPRWLPRARWA